MGSVCNRGGKYEIQFRDHADRPRTIRLGGVSRADANDFERNLDRLVRERAMGYRPSRVTAAWLEGLGSRATKKLHQFGLIDLHNSEVTVGELIEAHRKSLAVEESTERNIKNATDNIAEFFRSGTLISRVTVGDARTFRGWLAKEGSAKATSLASTTVSRRMRRARALFKFAVDSGWIQHNPFDGLPRGNEVNRERDFFVTRELATKVMGKIADLEFRGVFVLARFAGLRIPSEIHGLTWQDVNWEAGTLRVVSRKNRRHASTNVRFVPLSQEARAALDALWEDASPGDTLIFPQHQVTGTRLRTKLRRACERSDIPLWPRAWKNCRSSFETELFRTGEHDLADIARWLGHSITTATHHYLQIAKDRRAETPAPEPTPPKKRSKKRSGLGWTSGRASPPQSRNTT
jgi:integrase